MRVLVVEDHATLAGRIAEGLRRAGMAVDAVHDGAAALDATAQTSYDVIVLDRDLPGRARRPGVPGGGPGTRPPDSHAHRGRRRRGPG